MVSPGLVSATPWNHADLSHSTPFETASERLVELEEKMVAGQEFRKGTYVITSSERDKVSVAKDESGEYTAFTGLFTRRLRTGIQHIADDRLTMSAVVDALEVDAKRQGLPRPGQLDKFGLGRWKFIGNAAVVKSKTLDLRIKEAVREEVELLHQKLLAEFSKKIDATKSAPLAQAAPQAEKSWFAKLFEPPKTRFGIPISEWNDIPISTRRFLNAYGQAIERTTTIIGTAILLDVVLVVSAIGIDNSQSITWINSFHFVFYLVLTLQLSGGGCVFYDISTQIQYVR